MRQYTIRNVPDPLDKALRERAEQEGASLNETVIDAIRRGLGVAESEPRYDDLDDLAGTWQSDPEFDSAIKDHDKVDPDAWR